jgi:hypothetical protein
MNFDLISCFSWLENEALWRYEYDDYNADVKSHKIILPALYRIPLSTQATLNCKRESASFMAFIQP